MNSDDEQRVHGYAYTHKGASLDRIPRAELDKMVKRRPRVPLRLGFDGPIIGEVDLSVDDRGLLIDGHITEGLPDGF